ncbi:MAG: hydrogenase assembly protein HupF [Spirochaetae bacterium HGW-Spirochaetae-8]|jgi:[FeFe] hydrogenase (group B1/B3)|nr:MAG: hydrogenase assembly protein HupF [Spirochaetae bacterium HGW-Spirochaetae-8]
MLEINNQYTLMKRRIDTEVLRAYFAGDLEEVVDTLPIQIIPRERVPNRCCVYKERAMVRYRIMSLLGVDIDRDDDELKPLKAFVRETLAHDPPVLPTLTTISPGCSSCPDEQYHITDSCRGCFARPCMANCPKDAIVFINGRAQIIDERCVKCGKCLEVCPFHAVVHIPVPCEEACPVDAIKKNAEGFVDIDHAKCISCGHCARSCPFGAIVERSGLFPVVKMLTSGTPVVAMIAPAIDGQFPGSLAQIKAAVLALGFTAVVEVAQGASVTAMHEAGELSGRMEARQGYLTTSCCPAYMELVDKHLPFLKSRRSSALSPMAYTAKLCAESIPDSKRVFIGPCLAKKVEAAGIAEIDGVISFSELAALFIAKEIDVREMQAVASEDTLAFQDCREFACSQGVAHAVLRRVVDPDAVRVLPVDGVDRKTVRTMKVWEKRPPEADLVEVMCCEGGCLAGPGVVVNPKLAIRLRQGANVVKVGAVPLKR